MKEILLTVALAIALVSSAVGQNKTEKGKIGSSEDEKAIQQVIQNVSRGGAEANAKLATMDYAEDADWMNAWGMRWKGRKVLESFQASRFKNPNYKERRVTLKEPEIRFIRPDVALVHRYAETEGQKDANGQEMPKRRTHGFHVLTKENGKWLIVSTIYMDEKDRAPQKPAQSK